MAVAFDATTELGTATTGALTGTHTPSGTPRAIVVKIAHNTEANDLITGVTYGGVAMTRVGRATDTATEPGRVYMYFLGASIPTGAQTVTVSHTGNSTVKWAVVESYTAAADTEVGSAATINENTNNFTHSLTKLAEGMATGVVYTGAAAPGDLTPGAGISAVHDHDFGNSAARADRETSASSGSFSWTYTVGVSDDAAMVVVNIQEIGSGVRPVGAITNQQSNWTTTVSTAMNGDLIGKRLVAIAVSRDSTSGSADVTLTDNSGANTWTRTNTDADKKSWMWEKVGAAGDLGAIATVASAVGSTQLVILIFNDASGAATNISDETNSSGDETHASNTPSNANSYHVFAILDHGNDTNNPSSVSGATIGAHTSLVERTSTGGSDCRVSVYGAFNAGSSATGSLTWAQTNSTTKTISFFMPPAVTATAVTSVDSDYGTGSEEFDVDEDALSINGGGFASCDVYLSDVATLAGGSNEVDISAAIDSQSGTLITLDLTSLTTELADIEDLISNEGHDLFLIVDGTNGEDSIAVTVHRAKAWSLSASSNISASGDDTTAQLTSPSGKTNGDFGGGRIQDDESTTDAVDLTTDEYREDEWSITSTARAIDGETYEFRVLANGSEIETYSVTPEALIGSAVVDLSSSGANSSAGTSELTAARSLSSAGPSASDGSGDLLVIRGLEGSGASASAGTSELLTTRTLSSSAANASDGSGEITVLKGLSSSGANAAHGSSDLSVTRGLDSSGANSSAGESSIDLELVLDSSGANVSAGTAALDVEVDLSSSAPSSSDGTGELTTAIDLTGAGAAVSAGISDFLITRGLESSGTNASAGQSDLTILVDLASSGPSASDGFGSLAVDRGLESSGANTGHGSGDLSRAVPLESSGPSTSNGSGSMVLELSLSGPGASANDGTGALDITGQVSFDSTAPSVSAGQGELTVEVDLSASGPGSSSGQSDLMIVRGMSGSGASCSDGSGDLEINADVDLSATGSAASAGTAVLSVLREMSGSGAGCSDGHGDISIEGFVELAGAGSSVSAGTAYLGLMAMILGSGSNVSAGQSTLSVSGETLLPIIMIIGSEPRERLIGEEQFDLVGAVPR